MWQKLSQAEARSLELSPSLPHGWVAGTQPPEPSLPPKVFRNKKLELEVDPGLETRCADVGAPGASLLPKHLLQ